MKPTVTLLVLTLLAPVSLQATRIQRLSLGELRERAAAILVLDVVRSSCRTAGPTMIWTDYETRIVEVLRGPQSPGALLTLSFAGGAVDGTSVRIDGVPSLVSGSRYLIFLDDVPLRVVPAIGWGQGLYRIDRSGEDETLNSVEGECLRIDTEGRLVRRRVPQRTVSSGARLADPLVVNADGSIASAQVHRLPSHVATTVRNATLGDLRAFVRGAIRELRELGR